ncbi:hypothetical protein RNJ44_02196 [Nakaseomyces bracarensis]|uniref:Uncharacterized protein n=1 Tax=Nakaseomyces bracarensis TaxID=273131 RepID=A0ABR4NMX5_9SACH
MNFKYIIFCLTILTSYVFATLPNNSAMNGIIKRLNDSIHLLGDKGTNFTTLNNFSEDLYDIIQTADGLYTQLPTAQKDLAMNAVAVLFKMQLSDKDIITENYIKNRIYRIKHTLKFAIQTLHKLPIYTPSELQRKIGENKNWVTKASVEIMSRSHNDIISAFAEDFPECPPPLSVNVSYPQLISLLTDGVLFIGVMNGAVDACMGGFVPLCGFALTAASIIGGVWIIEIVKYFILCKLEN